MSDILEGILHYILLTKMSCDISKKPETMQNATVRIVGGAVKIVGVAVKIVGSHFKCNLRKFSDVKSTKQLCTSILKVYACQQASATVPVSCVCP